MRRFFTSVVLLSAVVSAGLAPSASAADKKAPDPAKIFAKRDANGDGSLTLEEFKTGLKDKALEVADKRFKRLDSNGDSKLSLDEFKAGIKPKS
jgi:Ca2+-binding EF-hand superfamily protein